MIKLVFRNLIWQQWKILPKISGKILPKTASWTAILGPLGVGEEGLYDPQQWEKTGLTWGYEHSGMCAPVSKVSQKMLITYPWSHVFEMENPGQYFFFPLLLKLPLNFADSCCCMAEAITLL